MAGAVSVFRELFVEVPQALLEAAVHEAERREAERREAERRACGSRVLTFDQMLPALTEIGERFGWRPSSFLRLADDRVTVLRVRLSTCGHVARFYFYDEHVEDTHRAGLVDYLYSIVEQPPQRGCYCVERPPICTVEGCCL